MKKIFIRKLAFLFLFLPVFLKGQTVVMLSVDQPPELGYELTATDTTMVRGDTISLGTGLIVSGGSGGYSFNWSPGEALNDSSLMNPLAYPEDSTTYWVTVMDSCGCSFSLSFTVNVQEYATPAGVIPEGSGLKVLLYPNPTSGLFKIQLTGEPSGKTVLVIMEISGRTIHRQILPHFSGVHTEVLDLRLSSGTYNLLIDSGTGTINRRFIIN